ncbi:MAG: potassium transporter TrkG [Burkholderiales bacterium]|nr:potassium transporter TrkG [Burkholderiales bacterium]
MANGIAALGYAVRIRVVAKYLGQLALVLAGLMAVPLALAVVDGETAFALRFAAVCALLAVLGVPLARLAVSEQVQPNEALAVIAFGYLLAGGALAVPLAAGGLDAIDALFEAVSGVTTTGLTTLGAEIERQPRVFLFARAWAQWYGGLGIVVLSVALLLGNHVAARRLVDPEGAGENLSETMRTHARRVLVVYALITLAGIGIVLALGAGGFEAVAHVLTAVSTGGFSTHADSLAGIEAGAVRSALLGIALLGAVSLPLYYRAWVGGWRRFASDPELHALLALSALFAAALWWCLPEAPGLAPGERAAHAAWIAVSAQTGTGFSTLPIPELGAPAMLVLLAPMIIGGAIGSTTGGVKLLRLLLLARLVQLLVRRTALPPHAVAEVRFGGRSVSAEELARALLLIVLFLLTVGLSWLPFVALGHAPLEALFEVVSAVGTVGLSSGVAAPGLDPGLKLVLIADMLLGRVEFVALLVLFYPRTWIGKRASN